VLLGSEQIDETLQSTPLFVLKSELFSILTLRTILPHSLTIHFHPKPFLPLQSQVIQRTEMTFNLRLAKYYWVGSSIFMLLLHSESDKRRPWWK